ncbi:MAG: polyphosphate kinase 1 [Planctomycetota bacterium]
MSDRLDDPRLYFNRELSQLQFVWRVLDQALHPETPLLERLRFLTITSAILDEFFEIRVAGLRQQVAFDIRQAGPDGLGPREQLQRISLEAHRVVAEQYRILNEVLLPQLGEADIEVVPRGEWSRTQEQWARRFFTNEVLPLLTPMALDPAHPFPVVLNKGLSFIVSVAGHDAYGRASGLAVLQVPRALPRIVPIPHEGEGHRFTMLSSIVHAFIDELFLGMDVQGCYQFRVTRNSDLWVNEEEVEDLLQAVAGELTNRRYGEAVRLEVANTCSEDAANTLLEALDLADEDLYRVHGPVNLTRLAALYDLVDRPDLKFAPFVPGVRRRLRNRDLFAVLRRGDVLLHQPYESFAPVVELLQQAASDPQVLAIKQTLYRTDGQGAIVQGLLAAARAGKEVTAVVELRARFDEERNIDLATRLQEAGANVVYGIVGYKTHCKMLLVLRREGRRLRRYAHLSTGNYHAGTARAYTDFGLLTCDVDLAEDVHRLFQQLTGLGKAARLRQMLQAPFTLHVRLLEMIERERQAALAGRPASIRCKMNALTEPKLVHALYRASQAGVEIDLIVRGICRLRPQVPGVSDRIRVRSIVGRFLEHSRVFQFHAGGQDLVFLASADWMERNMMHRVEVAFPITDERMKARIVEEGIDLPLSDNTQAWLLQSDGTYKRARPGKGRARAAQQALIEQLADAPVPAPPAKSEPLEIARPRLAARRTRRTGTQA